MMKTVTKKYKIVSFKITPNTIDQFEAMEDRRLIGDSQVAQIYSALVQGKNPMSVLIVNLRNGRYRLIDGNHRIEAVKRFYSNKNINKEISIECVLKVYENLSNEEEKQVYEDEARRRNESYEDRLNLHKSSITFWNLLQDKMNNFPCQVSIYKAKDAIRFRIILNALYTVKNCQNQSYSPQSLKKEEMVEFAKDLVYVDYLLLKEFMDFFQRVFGKIGEGNKYTKTQFFLPLIDIYWKNQKYKKENNFEKRFERLVGQSDILNYINTNGREWKVKIRELMLSYVNHGFKEKKFI